MKDYQYSKQYVLEELNMLDGFILYSFAVANDPLNRFGGIEMVDSYQAREAEQLYDELLEIKKKQTNT